MGWQAIVDSPSSSLDGGWHINAGSSRTTGSLIASARRLARVLVPLRFPAISLRRPMASERPTTSRCSSSTPTDRRYRTPSSAASSRAASLLLHSCVGGSVHGSLPSVRALHSSTPGRWSSQLYCVWPCFVQ
eukprot:1614703-Prymnesium_polylepis.1